MGLEGNLFVAVLLVMLLAPGNPQTGRGTAQGEQGRWACGPPYVKNPPPQILIPEDGSDSSLELNYTCNNSGVFCQDSKYNISDWPLTFSSDFNPDFEVSIDNNNPSAPVTIRPNRDWNGDANLTFTATDLYGKSNSTIVHVRVSPVEDPPFVKARIPDFIVSEGATNLTMKDIDLFNVFGDPDLPPFGDDNLTFKLDNSTFPAVIVDSKLTFGKAPRFHDGRNHIIEVTVAATDKCGMNASDAVNITVLNGNHAPEQMDCEVDIAENEVSFYNLHGMFIDLDGDPMSFVYLGGASRNLSVEVEPNLTARFDPSPDYVSEGEWLRFEAMDPEGANCTAELNVHVCGDILPPFPSPGHLAPDPLDELSFNEGEAIVFHVGRVDYNGCQSLLQFTWFVDAIQITMHGGPSFIWTPSFDAAGQHIVRVYVSDGLAGNDAEWSVSVLDVNRPPVILDVWPLNNTEVSWNAKVTFRANASDPDGDQITFYWREQNGTILKYKTGVTTSVFSKVFSSNTRHTIILEVEDDKGAVASQSITITVGKKPSSTPPGICAPMLFTIVPIFLMGMTMMLKRKRLR